ncbi:MAG: hypothetical protein KDE34_19630 [Anaerolineales bacterium]|nr:hypothetical protein [Anaerolineales bacterium]
MIEPTVTFGPGIVPTVATDELSLMPDDVVLFPVPAIYAGDLVSFQILPDVPADLAPDEILVQIFVDGEILVEGGLVSRNLAGQSIGLFEWVWDTTSREGVHELRVVLDPDDRIQVGDLNQADNEVRLDVLVKGAADRPVAERNAAWLTHETESAVIHVITGTAAHRDLEFVSGIVDAAIQQASQAVGATPAEKLQLYLIERVIGQGGYAGSVMVISYLDRDYAGDGFYEVLVHESVHLIDRQFAPNRIPFLGEGVAVWATGGHYKIEDIDRRAAALLETGLYIPLPALIDDFYPVQHEIGYLAAAGFEKYLIDQYGWGRFRDFYASFDLQPGERYSAAVDRQLQTHYGLTLAQAEVNWLAFLRSLSLTEADVADLLGTVRYYNVMRHYQRTYDPTAYYLEAWLPFPGYALEQGITADFIRHPQTPENIALETMLVATDRALRAGDFQLAAVQLDSIEQVLATGKFADPLSANYLQLVKQADTLGYEVQVIELTGRSATVLATPAGSSDLRQLHFDLNGGAWVLAT